MELKEMHKDFITIEEQGDYELKMFDFVKQYRGQVVAEYTQFLLVYKKGVRVISFIEHLEYDESNKDEKGKPKRKPLETTLNQILINYKLNAN